MNFRYLWVKEDGTVLGTNDDVLAERALDTDEYIVDTEGEIEEFTDKDFPEPDSDD